MDVITMVSTNSLLNKLRKDYPHFSFAVADMFWWSPKEQTIHVDQSAENFEAFCLHELSHAILGHQGYIHDIELVKMEREAWDYVTNTLAPTYDIAVNSELIQDNLDTYREWMHMRSTCPQCKTTGLQMKSQHYHCLGCGHSWVVNEARLCALRRYSINTK